MELHDRSWWWHGLLVCTDAAAASERFSSQITNGVGKDWPITYDDLEEAYCDAEAIMAISGDPDMARIMPRHSRNRRTGCPIRTG